MEHQAARETATASRLPVTLEYYEACRSEGRARLREKELKTGFGGTLARDDVVKRSDRKAASFQHGAALGSLETLDAIGRVNQIQGEGSGFQKDDLAAGQNRDRQRRVQLDAQRPQRAQNPLGILQGAGQKNINVLGRF